MRHARGARCFGTIPVFAATAPTLGSGKYSGASTYDADLTFTAPAGKPAGTYTSTLTLTLISQ